MQIGTALYPSILGRFLLREKTTRRLAFRPREQRRRPDRCWWKPSLAGSSAAGRRRWGRAGALPCEGGRAPGQPPAATAGPQARGTGATGVGPEPPARLEAAGVGNRRSRRKATSRARPRHARRGRLAACRWPGAQPLFLVEGARSPCRFGTTTASSGRSRSGATTHYPQMLGMGTG